MIIYVIENFYNTYQNTLSVQVFTSLYKTVRNYNNIYIHRYENIDCSNILFHNSQYAI